MKLYTRRGRIVELITNYRRTYIGIPHDDGQRAEVVKQGKRADKLEALDAKTCSRKQVDEILGHYSTEVLCDECGEDVESLIEFEPNGLENNSICLKCLQKAIELILKK